MYPNNMQGGVNMNYNPYMSPYNSSQYNRLAGMEQQQFAAQQAALGNYGMGVPSQPQNMIKGRPVVSMEEARAAQIDLDGSMFVFTDVGNKKIYTKQINLDGTATLNTYALVNDSEPKSPEQTYVTRSEMDSALASIRKELLERSNLLNAEQYKSIPNVNGGNGPAREWQQPQPNASSNGPVREQPAF